MCAVAHDSLPLTPWRGLQGCNNGLFHAPFLVLLSMELGCVSLLVGPDPHVAGAGRSPRDQLPFDRDISRVRLEAIFLSEGSSNRGNSTRWEPYRLRISKGDARVNTPLRYTFRILDGSSFSSDHSGSDPPSTAELEWRCLALHTPFPAEDRPPISIPRPSPRPPSSAGHGLFASNVCGPQGCPWPHHTNSKDRSDVHIVQRNIAATHGRERGSHRPWPPSPPAPRPACVPPCARHPAAHPGPDSPVASCWSRRPSLRCVWKMDDARETEPWTRTDGRTCRDR